MDNGTKIARHACIHVDHYGRTIAIYYIFIDSSNKIK
jgi:hypothetical protein